MARKSSASSKSTPSTLAWPPLREATKTFCEQNSLTQRECDVVFLLASGTTQVTEIAMRLQLRPNTVHNHLKGIFRRTGTHSKSELLAALLQHGLEHGERRARLRRPPQILVLDGCHALAPQLTGLGMRVQLSANGTVAPEPDAPHVDVVVSPWTNATRARSLRQQVSARLGSATRCLFVAPADEPGSTASREGGALAVRSEHVAFEILMLLSDGPYERSRLQRVDKELPMLLDGRTETQLANVGFGGAFALLPPALLLGPSALRVGDGVEIAFTLPDHHRVRARAAVVWTRPRGRIASPAGAGLRFTALDSGDLERIEELVRQTQIGTLASITPRTTSIAAA